jgi:DnaK suppressor protein
MSFAFGLATMDHPTSLDLKNLLLNRRAQILGLIQNQEKSIKQEVTRLESGVEPSLGEVIDMAQTLEQQDRDASLALQERRELDSIERALAKMATGSFGVCEDCEEVISPRRLQALPEARFCARCQAAFERENQRHAKGFERRSEAA